MFEIKGKIEFDPVDITKKHHKQSSWKKTALVNIEGDICQYYAWLLHRRYNIKLNKNLRGAHITIINDIVDDSVYNIYKEKYNNKEITFLYDPEHIGSNDKGHWWMKVYSKEVEEIRESMQIGNSYFGLHLTIGLATHLELEQSLYIRSIGERFNFPL